MHLIQFEALSSGPRLGLLTGGDVFALSAQADLSDMAQTALAHGTSLAEQVQVAATRQRFSLNELLLDGRVRPPIWPDQPEHLQFLRQSTAGWQALADGRTLCRPAMPLPTPDLRTPQPLLLLAVWVAPDGQSQPLGLTLGLTTRSSDLASWSFGTSLWLTEPAWGAAYQFEFEISRMAAPLHHARATIELPTRAQLDPMLASLGATAASFVLADLSSAEATLAPPEHALEHGDALIVSAPSNGLELRSVLHHDAKP